MGECELKVAGGPPGRAWWRRQGEGWLFGAQCREQPGMVYRVLLETRRGGHVLGVMMPEGGLFRLEKKLPTSLVRQLGPELAEIQGASVIAARPGEYRGETGPLPFPPEAFQPWRQGEGPLCPLLEPELEEAQALVRRWGREYYLAAPLEPGRPFGLACVFCLAEPLEIGGRPYGVVKIDENGNLSKAGLAHTSRPEGADYL